MCRRTECEILFIFLSVQQKQEMKDRSLAQEVVVSWEAQLEYRCFHFYTFCSAALLSEDDSEVWRVETLELQKHFFALY